MEESGQYICIYHFYWPIVFSETSINEKTGRRETTAMNYKIIFTYNASQLDWLSDYNTIDDALWLFTIDDALWMLIAYER